MFENADLNVSISYVSDIFDQYMHYILHLYNINVNNMVDAMFIFWLISMSFQALTNVVLRLTIGG